ncbi:hypothetical protein [Tabrizicola sp.]|uniref:hypothetical protein n=1 Tax=Tabrizicola sp. TaxID=2005166 RepID=UPI003F367434
MDFSKLTELAEKFALKDYMATVANFEVPVPDAAMLALFAVLIFALQRSQRAAVNGMRATLEAAYAEELLTANRRGHRARSDLVIARREIEHERQRKRGLQRKRIAAEQGGGPRPVSVLREVATNGVARL